MLIGHNVTLILIYIKMVYVIDFFHSPLFNHYCTLTSYINKYNSQFVLKRLHCFNPPIIKNTLQFS